MIDPYLETKNRGEWNWTLGKHQYDWFRQTLESSKSKFKFVFSHQLVGGSGKEGRGGTEFADLYEMGERILTDHGDLIRTDLAGVNPFIN